MKKKIIIAALVFIVALLITLFVYRFVFEFNNEKVKSLLKDEANQYGDSKDAVYNILHQSVNHILKSAELTKMVRTSAKASGLEKEKVLVDMAIAQAQAFKYLKV